MELDTELAELNRKWNCLLEKFDNLGRITLFKIIIAKAEKMLLGEWFYQACCNSVDVYKGSFPN